MYICKCVVCGVVVVLPEGEGAGRRGGRVRSARRAALPRRDGKLRVQTRAPLQTGRPRTLRCSQTGPARKDGAPRPEEGSALSSLPLTPPTHLTLVFVQSIFSYMYSHSLGHLASFTLAFFLF